MAAATVLLALFTIGLAVIGWRALRIQGREIKATDEQLRLARDEFRDAQLAARPELDAKVSFTDWQNVVAKTKVSYVHGLQPAYRVDLVIRRPDDVLCGGDIGTLTPMKSRIKRIFGTLPAYMEWPAHIRQEELADQDYQLALTWTRTDEEPAYMSWVVRSDGREEWVSGSRDLRRRR